ncbi:serine/threonine-protein kinase [Persicimonas caeni]|uniref:serine/threonine-protein kinase n=1 Tax=Persicimonas caeni TaxID=2292766 RepID=UPI00143DA897|nr:serine/threonine-protein kinase [Persicimonas caeni]
MEPTDELDGRYALEEKLVACHDAEVWRGYDRHTGRRVAVKIATLEHAALTERWREAAILRRLQVPGIVQLLDEGIAQGRSYLVTPWVEGVDFPGHQDADETSAADGLVAVINQVAETLVQIHAAGIVHGDLKPANVLVDRDHRATVLDFGLSNWTADTDELARVGRLHGTAAYMSPAQLRGAKPTVACDCYAFGVMCYEALSGAKPHPTASLPELMRARLRTPSPALECRHPAIPQAVLDAVRGLLSANSAERLQSLHALRRSPPACPSSAVRKLWSSLPFVTEARRDIEAQRRVRLGLRHGCRPGDCRRALAEAFASCGCQVVALGASKMPFGSMPAELQGALDPGATLDQARATYRAHLAELLANDGRVLVEPGVDAWTGRLVDEFDRHCGVVRIQLDADEASVEARPPRPEQLVDLFDGPERLHRVRSRAAQILWEQTGGHIDAMVRQFARWQRRGLVFWRHDKCEVSPASLDHMREPLAPAPLPPLPPKSEVGEFGLELMRWLHLGAGRASDEQLASWLGAARWRVEAELETLLERGYVRVEPDGSRAPAYDPLGEMTVTSANLQHIHKTLAGAIEPGSPQRFWHLLCGDSVDAIAAEGPLVARHYDRRGDTLRAIAVLRQSLAMLQRARHVAPARRLLDEWATLALATGEPQKLEGWLRSADHWRADHLESSKVYELVYLARLGCRSPSPEVLDRIDQLEAFDDWQLELRRQMYRVRVASACSTARYEETLADIEPWVEQVDQREVHGTYAGWMGMLHFREGRYEQAARCHRRAAATKSRPTARLASMIAEATARLEQLDYERCLELASEHLELARRVNHVHYQARLEYLQRASLYRLGRPLDVDEGWVDAVELLGLPKISGLVGLLEAAIAWRSGDLATAARFADLAHRRWADIKHRWGALLASALSWSSRRGATAEGAEILAQFAACPLERITCQGIALVAQHLDTLPAWAEQRVQHHLANTPENRDHLRLEILSPAELARMLDEHAR